MDGDYNECTKLIPERKDRSAENSIEGALGNLQSVSYLHLYKHSTRLDRIYISIGILLTLVTVAAVTVLACTLGEVTDVILSYVASTTSSKYKSTLADEKEAFIENISNFVLVNSMLGILAIVCTYLSTVLFNYSALNQTYKIKELFLSKVLNQDIAWYDLNQTGDFSSRVADDLKKVQDGIGEKVPIVLSYVGIFVASVLQAMILGWKLALVCMVSLPISLISMGFVSWITSTYTKREISAYGAAGAIAEEVLSAIKTVVAFGGEKKEEARYNKFLEFACRNNTKRAFFNGICNGAMWVSTYGCYALGFWFGVQLLLENRQTSNGYDTGVMVSVFFSIVTGTWFLTMALPYVETFGMAQGAAVKIFEVIASEPVINMSKGNGTRLRKVRGRITFRDVYFSYPSRPDLKGLHLTVNPGETVALVGSSGCGKSTCIQLIERFYDPNFGSVSIDNYNLTELDLAWIRTHIGVVGQEPVLFEASIGDNIKLGYEEATQDDIEEAAEKANAHSFIVSFPLQYETLVGERGMQLSGGQKQRIAIARALVRKPSILLLDEATSALDAAGEASVQAALDAASRECTTIIVAHRLSTIKRADRIVVISEGRVQEQGTHDQLMDNKGPYFNLIMAQVPQDLDDVPPAPIEQLESGRRKNAEGARKRQSSYILDMLEDLPTKISILPVWPILKHNAPEWWAIALGCLSSIVNGAGLPVYAILFGHIMQILVLDDIDYIKSQTTTYALYFLLIAIMIGFTSLFQTYAFGIAGEKLTMRLRSKMFQSYLSQELSYFDSKANAVGALCARLSNEPASVQGATGQRIGTILNSFSNVIFALVVSFFFEWRVTLVSLCIAPVLGLAFYLEPKLIGQEDNAYYKTLQTSAKIAVEGINAIRTVASLGCESRFFDLYMNEVSLYQQKSKRNAHLRGLIFGLSRGLLFFAYAIVLCYGSVLIVEEHLEFYKVFIVAESIITSSWSISCALAFTPNFGKGVIAANRIVQILNRVPLVRDGPSDANQRWAHPNVEYKKVRFSYPTRPKTLVLKNFDMRIFKGKTVALVGPSGCGKSTVVQLLERFYDPTSGSISVDDVPIRSMHLSALRSQLGLVAQEPRLFSLTVAENIAYGDNTRVVPLEEIVEAAKKANIHDFINSLPLGYDTSLGEKGTQLSGGQKQRIAIARALIRNPKILLLDEATSALDSEGEKIVQEALDNAKKGRTCIMIAHRLNTVQDADAIFVISQGRIVEMGTHTELLQLRGLYYNLYNFRP